MPKRFNAGHLLVILGAAALLVSLFIDWYEPGLSAWEVFEIGDLVLAALATVALVTALPMRLPQTAATQASERSLPWIGVAALVFVVVTLLNDPPAARDLPLEFGAWLGLIGAALMAVGGFLTKAQISIVIASRPGREASSGGATPSAATAPNATGEAPPQPTDRVEEDTATRQLRSEEPPPRP